LRNNVKELDIQLNQL